MVVPTRSTAMPITPYYERIANEIRAKIDSGEWPPGTKLPSTSQLCAQYDVSTQVIRSVMLILRSEGLVEGHQGKGVYVRERP
ncbi:winged helix-turn-helix domain-containing protein [Solwaraspora sp. WMMD1047]|uniref:winged helix-turn-helix domain-containing protein n=1 Tax=Solwaraspora sp. WMMD1047 TaxID=3016102 RepID=UPI002416E8D2|nr:winged helix-turn-helix domain-containing protein [Solwaraspora sp. WMMD1047]MDG4829481.1 winged helix-turn-helix domain-containing protein [Solwaraspora sp. WMMD1047]